MCASTCFPFCFHIGICFLNQRQTPLFLVLFALENNSVILRDENRIKGNNTIVVGDTFLEKCQKVNKRAYVNEHAQTPSVVGNISPYQIGGNSISLKLHSTCCLTFPYFDQDIPLSHLWHRFREWIDSDVRLKTTTIFYRPPLTSICTWNILSQKRFFGNFPSFFVNHSVRLISNTVTYVIDSFSTQYSVSKTQFWLQHSQNNWPTIWHTPQPNRPALLFPPSVDYASRFSFSSFFRMPYANYGVYSANLCTKRLKTRRKVLSSLGCLFFVHVNKI